nr:hypothetical protein [Tanacetum cinerariifolium]
MSAMYGNVGVTRMKKIDIKALYNARRRFHVTKDVHHFQPEGSFPDLYWFAPEHSKPLLCRLVLWLGFLDWKMFGVDSGELELPRGGGSCLKDDVDEDGEPCCVLEIFDNNARGSAANVVVAAAAAAAAGDVGGVVVPAGGGSRCCGGEAVSCSRCEATVVAAAAMAVELWRCMVSVGGGLDRSGYYE